MQDFTYITAFSVGLLGGVHCVGMCGGIVGALSFATKPTQGVKNKAQPGSLFAYNSGRIFSYTLAGGLMGGIGGLLTAWTDMQLAQMSLQLLAAIFMLMMGLYISGWWMGLSRIEKLGGLLWRYIKPHAQKLLPVRNWRSAFLLGVFWGWLPCGLVYSVLVWSVSAGSFYQGALLMFAFGLGTLPNLMAMGLFAQQLQRFVQHAGVRQLAGVIVILFGVWSLVLFFRGVYSL